MENLLKVIVFAGLPLSGKSTLAKELATRLEFSLLDIDEIRRFLFVKIPDSEKDRESDIRQMKASWKSLCALTEQLIQAQTSVVLAATFSRATYLQELFDVTDKYPVSVKIIYCFVSDEEIVKRLEVRGDDNLSNLRSMEGYNRVKARYEKISAPNLLEVNTSQSPELCLEKIIQFVGR